MKARFQSVNGAYSQGQRFRYVGMLESILAFFLESYTFAYRHVMASMGCPPDLWVQALRNMWTS